MFQAVQNRGGRASCQDDFTTFQIMRNSQFLAWSEELRRSYLQDLDAATVQGSNLLSLKYAWMMEDTFPQEFQEIREHLPTLSPTVRSMVQEILSLQLSMTEKLFLEYPLSCAGSRPIHPVASYPQIASIETYLRGELYTYSEKTLELYLHNLRDYISRDQNYAEVILEYTARQYGYSSLAELEASLATPKQSRPCS